VVDGVSRQRQGQVNNYATSSATFETLTSYVPMAWQEWFRLAFKRGARTFRAAAYQMVYCPPGDERGGLVSAAERDLGKVPKGIYVLIWSSTRASWSFGHPRGHLVIHVEI
jgi:hypothetical protein